MIAVVLIILVGTIVYRLAISSTLLKRDKGDTLGANGMFNEKGLDERERERVEEIQGLFLKPSSHRVGHPPSLSFSSVCNCLCFRSCAQPCGHLDSGLLLLICCRVADKLGESQDNLCVRDSLDVQDCPLPVCQHVLFALFHRVLQGKMKCVPVLTCQASVLLSVSALTYLHSHSHSTETMEFQATTTRCLDFAQTRALHTGASLSLPSSCVLSWSESKFSTTCWRYGGFGF